MNEGRIKLREITPEDYEKIRHWRNTNKEWFYTSQTIIKEENTNFWESFLSEPTNYARIITYNEEDCGVIRLSSNDRNVWIVIDEQFRNLGIASEVINRLKGPLIADINPENIASVKAFEKAGFKKYFIRMIRDPEK
jgi:RimJ/RimL family protein N-acetyltransferase